MPHRTTTKGTAPSPSPMKIAPSITSPSVWERDAHSHHHHDEKHAFAHRNRFAITTPAFALVVATTCLTGLAMIDDVTQLFQVYPRRLMQDQSLNSHGHWTGHQSTLGGAVLLRVDPFFQGPPSLRQVNRTTATHTLHRVVYMEGSQDEWRHNSSMERPNASPPRQQLYNDRPHNDDNDNDTLEDLTRWYPHIDSNDERFHIERRTWPIHEIDPQNCHPMHDWQSASFPICNTVHEKDVPWSIMHHDMDMVSKKGFWRRAWSSPDTQLARSGSLHSKKMVWKLFKIHHSMEDAFFENNRVDALVMERLTGSPHVIDIYGFCAMTVIQEFAGRQIHECPLGSTEERLDIAIQVARGIRDIHYIGNSDRPSLVANDINLANILVSDDGRPVLNDFNIAVLLMEREHPHSEVCPFYSRFPNPQWRSPEEQVESEEESKTNPPIVSEKIDIYAMGNVLYRLVAGGSPWKRKGAIKLSPEEKMQVALAKRYNGTLPPLPDHVRLDDPATLILYQAMQMCYHFRPSDRPTAKQLVEFLESARSRLFANRTVSY